MTPKHTTDAKHTPGPWFESWVGNDGDYYLHISSPTKAICDLPMFQYGNLPPSLVNAEREANARLIASAPESIAANRKAITKITQLASQVNHYAEKLGLGRKIIIEDWIDDLQAVIAKVEGRE